ncbi:uncharacterized protein KRP23_6090 [Phytophthora ramorum]|uniref:uncharacterized protein n=1 Tax=Phytophthora ramorum TaxID=164328 RepID=UPI0030B37548|nr:hypothetical protein KRP23_6090 [Phytophthora ramorum]
MMLRAFVLFSLQAAAVQAKRSSVSSLEDLGIFIAVVIATKMLPLPSLNHIDRVILLSGDGDFHSSLGFVRNELRKEPWVVSFWDTVSGDLQQLTSKISWINDIWSRVKVQDEDFVALAQRVTKTARRFRRIRRVVHANARSDTVLRGHQVFDVGDTNCNIGRVTGMPNSISTAFALIRVSFN